ncbi:hypothetical protein N4R57_10780 [Rhodobacteraceae bacterium D3-12]|nr:hypothetical protein N4R57_10780 [Rhodobacteraceae bacterium D3-12]
MTDTVCEGLEAHLDEFVEHPLSKGGYFVSKWNASIEPLNHTHLYAAVAAEAYAITRNERYRDVCEKSYNFFRHNWYEEKNGTVSWAYAPTPDNKNIAHPECSFGERSFSHVKGAELFFKAAVTIELPLAMHRVGILDKSEIELIAKSLRVNVMSNDDSINMYISPRKQVPDSVEHLQKQKIRPEFLAMYYLLAPFDGKMKLSLDDLFEKRKDWFPNGLISGPSQLLAYSFLHYGGSSAHIEP